MKKNYPFVYKATLIWNDGPPDFEVHHYRTAGVGFCEDFTDAMRQIESRESDALESIEHLELLEECNEKIIEVPSAWIKALITTDSFDYLKPIEEGDI